VLAAVGMMVIGASPAGAGVRTADRRTPVPEAVAVSTGGAPANGTSFGGSVSANGRYVVFDSVASNLVPGDTNGQFDVFVRDAKLGLTRRVSLDTAGAQARFGGGRARISANARYVVFTSSSPDLVVGDTNGTLDVFVRDLRYGITKRASLTAAGGQIDTFTVSDSISADGRYVVFSSYGTSEVVPGDTNSLPDVFVRDMKKNTTTRVSVASDGSQALDGSSTDGSISADGRYVAFTSYATNLVSGDTNRTSDVFRHDLKTGETIRVSLGPGGRQSTGGRGANPTEGSILPSLSSNGRFVSFTAYADGLVDVPHGLAGDVYVRDIKSGTTTLASPGLGGAPAEGPVSGALVLSHISGDGRYVGFTSQATNLVPNDTNGLQDAFLRDLKRGSTQRVSLRPTGEQGNGRSYAAVPSKDGKVVVFDTDATNLVAGGMTERGVLRVKLR
jgi:Tol biopolymer transport system component